MARVYQARPLLFRPMAALREGRLDDVEVEHDRPARHRRRARARRSTPGPRACRAAASCCIRTSWASGRCSTTCAAGSRPTGSRCARRSRSPTSTCAELDPMARMERVAGLEDAVQIGDLERAADHLVVHDDVARRRDPRVLHGRDVRAEGRGDRSLRPRGRVLRDDPRPRGLARPGAAPSRSTPRPSVCPTLAIFGDADHCTPAADIDALRARVARPARLRDRRLRRRRARFRARCRPARRTAPTTPPTRGPRAARSSASTEPRDRAADEGRSLERRRHGFARSSSWSRSRMW